MPLLVLSLLFVTQAHADPCDDLATKVTNSTQAQIQRRSGDFVNFTGADGVTLTLSCGDRYPSSVGAQFRGETPPPAYFTTFAAAGAAVTGIAADLLSDAAHRARADAEQRRHGNIEAGGAMVTCSFTRSEKGPLTMCAVIERADRS